MSDKRAYMHFLCLASSLLVQSNKRMESVAYVQVYCTIHGHQRDKNTRAQTNTLPLLRVFVGVVHIANACICMLTLPKLHT